MSYVIFRVEPINKLKDLGQIGAHNLRKKDVYKSNPDIDKSKSNNNIDLIPCSSFYDKYMAIVKTIKSNTMKNKKLNEKIERKALIKC